MHRLSAPPRCARIPRTRGDLAQYPPFREIMIRMNETLWQTTPSPTC
jgi:hypothetical protein